VLRGFESRAQISAWKCRAQAHRAALVAALARPDGDLLAREEKIKGAVRTDFVLSAEIIVIALGTVAIVRLRCRSAYSPASRR
jgi:predicted DNA repair protein MutK